MALELPRRESFAARSGNSYSYIHIQPTSRDTTLLLLHGFPSTLSDWIHQIRYFSSEGYGILAPDLLGYGSSSKPSDVHQYRLKAMGDELIELLDHLNLQKVVGIGHDFGATLLSRLAVYHPDRWTCLVFLAVGPPRLGTPFDVNMINKMTKEFLGFEMLGYIPWIADPATPSSLEKHAEAAMSLIFCRDRQAWDEWFHPLGKMKQFVTEDRRLPIGPWYTDDLQKEHLKAFGVSDGYKGASRWYRMWMDNLFAPDEKGFENFQISQPQMLASWAPKLQTVKLDAGHWIHLERPEETNTAIQQFLEAE
ncbi:uncharacterized protein NECHADRAFT_30431 [Fusarium vanettenii 77-13-4]|uniref:AB hydrolase-1 domain-containing protein n=1 Tax=Fusarium vanettenii (strain ATCC MYA-4622 / CBS 123669 / FGSC 9596 / NRRL 45880 / 77-13-4) TaxID=660122 RepID=C7YVQ8_FUSV7|nr:uncharacterized protein NECHADRAFT_30431 [Fusarium vanettenii 77-13-4]EEU43835.1 hypothetical protein NECHADRAFT_30431 [Fusarium vanettenii 77-13-4]